MAPSTLTLSQTSAQFESEGSPFAFLKARYIVELTGKRAANLADFLDYLKTADISSIFYHFYHPLLDSHLVPYEFPNDFSYWFSDTLQDKDLAEQMGNFDLPYSGGLNAVGQILISIIEQAALTESNYNVRPGNEFNFVNCRVMVFPTGRVARNLDELADGIFQASELSVFYHMVTSGYSKHLRMMIFRLDFVEYDGHGSSRTAPPRRPSNPRQCQVNPAGGDECRAAPSSAKEPRSNLEN